ncbi:hypothetical protein [Actinoallomurus iriomotensis]|nr:hypothetical protein [Actinoallomurus iriomotensis]
MASGDATTAWLIDRRNGADGYARAVLTAAADVVRLGVRSPIPAGLLEATAPEYRGPGGRVPADWFERSMTYLTASSAGQAPALAPAGTEPQAAGRYDLAAPLLRHIARARAEEKVPAGTWRAVVEQIGDKDDLERLAWSAEHRLLYCFAVPLWRRAIEGGSSVAPVRLAGLLAAQGATADAIALLRGRSDLDDDARGTLADLLAGQGEVREALDVLRARGGWRAATAERDLFGLLVAHGRLDDARALVREDDRRPSLDITRALADHGRLDDLPRRAGTGGRTAVFAFDRFLMQERRFDELRARADAGDSIASTFPAKLLYEEGRTEELRSRADAGDISSSARLAELLVRQGAVGESRSRADAGDRQPGAALAAELERRGEIGELRRRCDDGDHPAARRYALLPAAAGRVEEARSMFRWTSGGRTC